MSAHDHPVCTIIAGPNGAGKTTFALNYLPRVAGTTRFVNADLIAAGLAPLAPESQLAAASRLFLREIDQHIARRNSFAFETTLSGRGYLRRIDKLRQDGWRVELYYLALPTVELSHRRVAERVAHGGHSIPPQDIERRFPRSLYNLLELYSERVDFVRCLMNTADEPALVFEQVHGQRDIFAPMLYQQLKRQAQP